MFKIPPILWTGLRLLVTATAFYYMFHLVSGQWPTIHQALDHLHWAWVGASVILLVFSLTVSVQIWRQLMSQHGLIVPCRWAWKYWIRSMVVRYIPGTIWGLAARGYVMRRGGLSKTSAVSILVIESLVGVLSALIIYLVSPAAQVGTMVINVFVIIGIVVLTGFMIFFASLAKLLNRFSLTRWIGVPTGRPSWTTIILFWIHWIIIGSSLFVLAHAFQSVPLKFLPFCIGAYAISWSVGYLAPFAPGGLGVREAGLTFFLAPVLGLPLAAILAILFRIVFILGEALCWITTIGKSTNQPEHVPPLT